MQRLDVSKSMIEFERLLTALIKRMLNGDSVTRQEGGGVIFHLPPNPMLFLDISSDGRFLLH